jgi:ABC-2 type transport system permease protein
MRRFLILLLRELSAFYRTPVAYVVLSFFLLLTGLAFWIAIETLSQTPSETTLIQAFFGNTYFWATYLLVFPLITMRSFAEEFKAGTIESVMTAPVRDWEIVGSKFVAILIFYMNLWLPSLLYFFAFSMFGNRAAIGSSAQIWAPYILLLVMGMFNLSLGCLTSALTSNQIAAAMMSGVLVIGLFFLSMIKYLGNSPFLLELMQYIAQFDYMQSFSKGIMDSRPLVLYPSLTLLVLAITYHVFQYRRWKR